MHQTGDTIAALATAPGEGAIAIIRISGPEALSIAARLCEKPEVVQMQTSHTARHIRIIDPQTAGVVDDPLLLLFRAPRSYTGEDIVEIHCHGGHVTTSKLIELVLRGGARLALPGEFTQRAFLNGKLDLAQAEAVCDQIRAKTDAAHRLAVQQRGGSVSRVASELREQLLSLLAEVEATIDFSEEIGEMNTESISHRISELSSGIFDLIGLATMTRTYREGARVAIVGLPNAGKSSLLNALLRRNRAIVTDIPGTTRDTLEEQVTIAGAPVTLIDTAGLRETTDHIELEGVERARKAAFEADAVLRVIDLTSDWQIPSDEFVSSGMTCVVAANKCDLLPPDTLQAIMSQLPAGKMGGLVAISAKTGEGIEELEKTLAHALMLFGTESSTISNSRHIMALDSANGSLKHALDTLAEGMPADFVSIDLRGALDAIGQITGETTTQEVIDRIFRDFCIGK